MPHCFGKRIPDERFDITKFDPKPDGFRVYESIWRNIERENALINYRGGWCIFLTASVLAAETIMATAAMRYPIAVDQLLVSGAALSTVISVICLTSALGVAAALSQIDYLRSFYTSFYAKPKSGDSDAADKNGQASQVDWVERNYFEFTYGLPRPFGETKRHFSGHLTAAIFPLALCLIWSTVAVVQWSWVGHLTASVMMRHDTTRH